MWNAIKKVIRDEQGSSIVLVYGVLVLLGILASTGIVISFTQKGVVSYVRWRKTAFNAAEAGANLAISRLPLSIDPFPTPPAIWDTLPNRALYKSGLPDSTPEIVKIVQINKPAPGYSIKFTFNRYKVVTSGKAGRVEKTVEVGVRCGPISSGTSY